MYRQGARSRLSSAEHRPGEKGRSAAGRRGADKPKRRGKAPRADAKRRSEPDVAYFAHSYACRPVDESVVTAWTVEDGDRFPSAVRWRNVVGVQFHPEKSSAPGVRFIREFLGVL